MEDVISVMEHYGLTFAVYKHNGSVAESSICMFGCCLMCSPSVGSAIRRCNRAITGKNIYSTQIYVYIKKKPGQGGDILRQNSYIYKIKVIYLQDKYVNIL